MEQKQVYSFAADGRFCGVTVADESPLEPGVFLLPANTTELPPNEEKEGFYQVFNGQEWAFCPNPVCAPLPPPEEKDPLSEQRAGALAALIESDRVLLRCYEDGLLVPSEWAAYRRELREVLSVQVVTGLPKKPAFPKGT